MGCLNIHPAFLPQYRGRYSTAHAIFNGENHTGVTLHWMDEGTDTGPIIFQAPIAIEPDDTAKSLYQKFIIEGEKLFLKFLDLWLAKKSIPSRNQDNSLATYYPKALPNNGKIDWAWPGEKIKNFIRAMTFEPYPPIEINIQDKVMIIVDDSLSTYHSKTPKNQQEIDWAWPGEKIKKFLQNIALETGPFVRFRIGEKNMVIVEKKFYKYHE